MYMCVVTGLVCVQIAARTVPVQGGVRHVLRLSASSGPALDVGFDSEEDLRDWSRTLTDAIVERKAHVAAAKVVQKRFKISSELSDLVFYSQAAHFRSFEASKQGPFNIMSSFAERKAFQVCRGKTPKPLKLTTKTLNYSCRRSVGRQWRSTTTASGSSRAFIRLANVSTRATTTRSQRGMLVVSWWPSTIRYRSAFLNVN
jgi:hypothetical protein